MTERAVEAMSPEQQRGYWWMWKDGFAPVIYERDYDSNLVMRWWLADGERDDPMPDDWHKRFQHVQRVSPPVQPASVL